MGRYILSSTAAGVGVVVGWCCSFTKLTKTLPLPFPPLPPPSPPRLRRLRGGDKRLKVARHRFQAPRQAVLPPQRLPRRSEAAHLPRADVPRPYLRVAFRRAREYPQEQPAPRLRRTQAPHLPPRRAPARKRPRGQGADAAGAEVLGWGVEVGTGHTAARSRRRRGRGRRDKIKRGTHKTKGGEAAITSLSSYNAYTNKGAAILKVYIFFSAKTQKLVGFSKTRRCLRSSSSSSLCQAFLASSSPPLPSSCPPPPSPPPSSSGVPLLVVQVRPSPTKSAA